jgi:hypothetical protein
VFGGWGHAGFVHTDREPAQHRAQGLGDDPMGIGGQLPVDGAVHHRARPAGADLQAVVQAGHARHGLRPVGPRVADRLLPSLDSLGAAAGFCGIHDETEGDLGRQRLHSHACVDPFEDIGFPGKGGGRALPRRPGDGALEPVKVPHPDAQYVGPAESTPPGKLSPRLARWVHETRHQRGVR